MMAKNSLTYQQGDLILSEDPWVYTVLSGEVDVRCYHCLRLLASADSSSPLLNKGNRCSACKYARYCSVECQKKDWKERHKAECFMLKLGGASNVRPPVHFLLMLKILNKLKTNFDDLMSSKSSPQSQKKRKIRTYIDLVSHAEELWKTPGIMEYITQVRIMLGKYLAIENDAELPYIQDVLQMFGKIKCNGFGITDDSMSACGVGIYLEASAFDHSCSANACQVFQGPRLTIRATRGIAHGIKNVRIAYIDCFVPKEVRMKRLMDGYLFECTCPRCVDKTQQDGVMFGLKCESPKCEAAVASDERAESPCVCGHKPKKGDIRLDRYDLLLEQFLQRLDGFDQEGVSCEFDEKQWQEDETFLRRMEDLLHPRNPLLACFCSMMGRMLLSWGCETAPQYFAKAAYIYRVWIPAPAVDPVMGYAFLQAVERDPAVGEPLDSFKRLIEAEKILRFTHGKDHSLYREAHAALRLAAITVNKICSRNL